MAMRLSSLRLIFERFAMYTTYSSTGVWNVPTSGTLQLSGYAPGTIAHDKGSVRVHHVGLEPGGVPDRPDDVHRVLELGVW